MPPLSQLLERMEQMNGAIAVHKHGPILPPDNAAF
jgi:hypothetical protein